MNSIEPTHAPEPSSAKVLDGYECARAWAAFSAAHRLVSDALADALASRFGLSINAFEVLLALAHVAPQPVRLCDLNRSVSLSQPALSRLIARLEADGLVGRVGAPEDRRGILITLTASGHDTFRRAAAVHADCVKEYFTNQLSDDEQRLLFEALTRVQAGMRAGSQT